MSKKIGILAIHGSVVEHAEMIRRIGMVPVEVRAPADLRDLAGLILPGGESTTISDLCDTYRLTATIQQFATSTNHQHQPLIYGTCAGLILLARWGLLDVTVERNAYGRQLSSFETDLSIPDLGRTAFPGVFIRAPKIITTGCGVRTLASHDDTPVLVQQGHIFGGSFHPELTHDTRVHKMIFG